MVGISVRTAPKGGQYNAWSESIFFVIVFWKKECCFRLRVKVRVDTKPNLTLTLKQHSLRLRPNVLLSPAPKCGTKPHPLCDSPLSKSAQRSFVALQKSGRNHRSYVWTEASPDPGVIFLGGTRAIQYSVNITFHNKIIRRLFYLQILLHLSTLLTLKFQ